MAKIVNSNTFLNGSGDLTILANHVPGDIKRMFFHGVGGHKRGGHGHHKTWNTLDLHQGSCRIYCCDGVTENYFIPDNPCMFPMLEPRDWHVMDYFSSDAILLFLSNQVYDPFDYIDEPYMMESVLRQL